MKKYLYIIKYPEYEKELCKMEQRSLFGEDTDKLYIYSDIRINPSRSPFIKERIEILDYKDNIDDITIPSETYNKFKVVFQNVEDEHIEYNSKLKAVKDIAARIQGEPDIHNPNVMFAITYHRDKWIFGKYKRNDLSWHIHESKPNNYSNALGIRTARALVNIAIGNDFNKFLVDPCCGIGTVVIEALSMDINVKGYEIKKQIASRARRNLEFFGYDMNYIKSGDINDLTSKYDVAIIDLPYGFFTPISLEEQVNIIKSARRISEELILVVFEDMKKIIEEAGFKIVETAIISKGKFKRIVHKCV